MVPVHSSDSFDHASGTTICFTSSGDKSSLGLLVHCAASRNRKADTELDWLKPSWPTTPSGGVNAISPCGTSFYLIQLSFRSPWSCVMWIEPPWYLHDADSAPKWRNPRLEPESCMLWTILYYQVSPGHVHVCLMILWRQFQAIQYPEQYKGHDRRYEARKPYAGLVLKGSKDIIILGNVL